MAEYSNVPVQTVTAENNVLFTNGNRACRKGYIVHRNDSGILTLRGITNQCSATYRVQFTGNVAIAAGETVGPISIALAINGEALGNATAIVTPAAVEEYNNVTSTAIITVPRGCCFSISVRAVSGLVDDAAGTPAPSINVTNSNLVITRIA